MEKTQQQEPGCNTCKKKNPNKFKATTSVVGIYILVTSGYGTVEIIKSIINYFTK